MQIKSSDKIAIIDGHKKISYSQLVEKIYYWIKIANISRGTNIALVADPSFDWLGVFLATLKRRAKINPIDPYLKATKLASYINHSSADTLVISKDYFEKVKKRLKGNPFLRNVILIEKKQPLHTPLPETATYRPEGYIPSVRLNTSGTTGSENGVLLSKANLLSNIHNIRKRNLINGEDRVLVYLPYYHAFGLITALGTLMLNATLILSNPKTEENFEQLIKTTKPTLIASVPLFFHTLNTKIVSKLTSSQNLVFKILRKIRIPFLSKLIFKKVHQMMGGTIRYMVSGGAELSKEVETNFRGWGFNLISGYGLTEASPIVAASLNSPIGSVGKPFDDTDVKIVDNEVLVKGPGVMTKYINPHKTNNTIVNGWLHTGDLGYVKRGYLYIIGRKKDLLVFHDGKKVHASVIENKIMKLSNLIRECSIIQKDNKIQIAIIPNLKNFKEKELDKIEEFLWKEVMDKYNDKVNSYNKITKILLFQAFPRTALNKVKKHLLKEEISLNAKSQRDSSNI